MKNIQFILLAMFLGGTWLYFTRMRSRLIDRVLVVVFTAMAAVMVIVPQITDRLASELGVGRGVDLIFCFMGVLLCYVCLLLYSKLRSHEARLVELTRWIALTNARLPDAPLESVRDAHWLIALPRPQDSAWDSALPDGAGAESLQPFIDVQEAACVSGVVS